MRPSAVDDPWLAPKASLATLGLCVGLVLALPHGPLERALLENGPIETASAVLHFAVAGVALALWRRGGNLFGLVALAAFLMGVREMDLHKAFTTHGIFSLKQYSYVEVPLAEKLLSSIAVLALATPFVIGLRTLRHDLAALRRGHRTALMTLVTLGMVLPALKIIDGLPRMMRGWGLDPSESTLLHLLAVEEIGEMVLPALVALLVFQLWRGPLGGRTVARSTSVRPS